jgi:protoheme IX farnesyltransferase
MAALGGAFLGSRGWPGFGNLLILLLTGGSAAAGASALNEYFERHSDGEMRRTSRRPLVTGAIQRPRRVLLVALAMILVPALAILPVRPVLSIFLLAGAVIYVGIYTLWLKPRTVLNIVIGGAAGSAAVLCGGAASGAWREPSVWILALLLFLWTPSHFWSLALLYRKDYQRSRFPMLSARISRHQAALWVMLHTLTTGLAGLALLVSPVLGPGYGVLAALAMIYLTLSNLRLIRDPVADHARSLFMASNYYLLGILTAVCLASVIPAV